MDLRTPAAERSTGEVLTASLPIRFLLRSPLVRCLLSFVVTFSHVHFYLA